MKQTINKKTLFDTVTKEELRKIQSEYPVDSIHWKKIQEQIEALR